MKHMFKIIDHIIKLLGEIPSKLRSDSDIAKSKEILNELLKYNQMLDKLIKAHKTEEHLLKLYKCHTDTIPDWANRIEEQFIKLNKLMKVLYEDIPKLKKMLEKKRTHQNSKNSNEWSNKVGDMAFGMIMAGFHYAEQNMEEFRKAEILEKKHLTEILEDFSAIEKL